MIASRFWARWRRAGTGWTAERTGVRSGTPPPLASCTRRYHFRPAGALYILITLLLALGAINSQNNLLFLALGLAIGGLLASGVISGVMLVNLRLERLAPVRVGAAQPWRLRYRVSNAGRWLPLLGIEIEEVDAARSHACGAAAVHWPPGFVLYVPARGRVVAPVVVSVPLRGRLTLHTLRARTRFPFGLVAKSVSFSQPGIVVVHPPVLPLRREVLSRIARAGWEWSPAVARRGEGDEFFGVREYQAGDSARRIVWKVSARTDRLVVREHAGFSRPRVWVVLRLGPGADRRAVRDNERAIVLGASVLWAACRAGTAAGLHVPGYGLTLVPRRSRAHVEQVLEALAMLDCSGGRPGATAGDGDRSPYRQPGPPLDTGAWVVVDAGGDASRLPPGSVHLRAAEAESLVVDDPQVRSVLEAIDRSVSEMPLPAGAVAWPSATGRRAARRRGDDDPGAAG